MVVFLSLVCRGVSKVFLALVHFTNLLVVASAKGVYTLIYIYLRLSREPQNAEKTSLRNDKRR